MTASLAPPDNEAWVRGLSVEGPDGEAAQRALRALLVKGLRRVLSGKGVAEDLCEDFAQEACVRIRERLGSFRGESRFTTWAMAIATRVAFDELRHKRWKDVSLDAVSADASSPIELGAQGNGAAASSAQDRALVRSRVLAVLREALEQALTPKQRQALVAELNEMPQAEIAAAMGMTRNALYKLSHDARKKVKAHLLDAGLTEADVLWTFE